MLRKLIYPLVLFILFEPGKAQTFNFTMTSDSLVEDTAMSQGMWVTANLENLSAVQSITVDVFRLQQTPPGPPGYWLTGMCTADTCYPTIEDTIALVLAPGQTQPFKMGFIFFKHNPDTAFAKVLFQNRNDLGNYFYKKFYARDSSPLNVSLSKHFNTRIESIYPNPSSSESVIQFSEHVSDAALTLYDLAGREVKRFFHVSGKSFKFQRGSLAGGSYNLRLCAGVTVSNIKLLYTD